jgi:hypothetical protein
MKYVRVASCYGSVHSCSQRAYGLLVKAARHCDGDPGKIMGVILGQLLEKVEQEVDVPVAPVDDSAPTA